MFKVVVAAALGACVATFYFLVLSPVPRQNLEPVKITAQKTNDPGPIEEAAIKRELGEPLPPCGRIRMVNMRHDEAAKLFNGCARNYIHLNFVGRAASDRVPLAGWGGADAEDFAGMLAVVHCDYVVTRRGYNVTVSVDPKVKCAT